MPYRNIRIKTFGVYIGAKIIMQVYITWTEGQTVG